MTASDPTEAQYIAAVLGYLGAPDNGTTEEVLAKWSTGEKPAGDWSQWWNLLNTTTKEPGSQSVNSVGVQSYATAQAGEEATAATIENGYYPALLKALRGGGPLSTFQTSAVVTEVEKTWGTKSFGKLVGSTAKVATGGAPAVAAASSGPDLNPLDWLGSAFGVAGQAAGEVAGGVAGGVTTGVADALGGVFKGLLTSAGGSMVALGTSLVIVLILVGSRGAQKGASTVINMATPSPSPAAAPAPSDDDQAQMLSDEEEAEYLKAYKAWQLDQGAQANENRQAGRQVVNQRRARAKRSAQIAGSVFGS